MSKHSKKIRKALRHEALSHSKPVKSAAPPGLSEDPSKLEQIPLTSQAITEYYDQLRTAAPFKLRRETMLRIERVTKRPLVCYTTKTHNLPKGLPAYIADSDVSPFADLLEKISGKEIDIFIISNGGSAEATERIVRLVRERFNSVRFIVAANAFSAATLMCLSGDEIIMTSPGTLGPIDPQIDGVPARAILRAFENIEERLVKEGPRALAVYMPLLAKYDLHVLELCRSAEDLSEELAVNWLSSYMLKCAKEDQRVGAIVKAFSSFDENKSHGRSIDRQKAKALGLNIVNVEEVEGLHDLVRSLANQYVFWFNKSPFIKNFESAGGMSWGEQVQLVQMQQPVVIPPTQPVTTH